MRKSDLDRWMPRSFDRGGLRFDPTECRWGIVIPCSRATYSPCNREKEVHFLGRSMRGVGLVFLGVETTGR